LVKDGIITNSKDPQFLRLKKSNKKRYVPDVIYTKKNEYNLEVNQVADPNFPADFCIVKLNQGAPEKENPLFSIKKFPFPIENRGPPNTIETLRTYMSKNPGAIRDVISEFHLLIYLVSNNILDKKELEIFVNCINGKGDDMSIKAIFLSLLPAPTTVQPKPTPVVQQPKPTPTFSPNLPKPTTSNSSQNLTPERQKMLNQLISMGLTEQDARNALFAVQYSSVDAAIDFHYK